jgi:hypothetical protein
MPSLETFEEYARRVEDEIPAVAAELTLVRWYMSFSPPKRTPESKNRSDDDEIPF